MLPMLELIVLKLGSKSCHFSSSWAIGLTLLVLQGNVAWVGEMIVPALQKTKKYKHNQSNYIRVNKEASNFQKFLKKEGRDLTAPLDSHF